MAPAPRVLAPVVVLLLFAPAAHADPHHVPSEGHPTIAAALADLGAWETVSVDAALYTGEAPVIVTRPVIIDSADGSTPVAYPNFVVQGSTSTLELKHGYIASGAPLTGTLKGDEVSVTASILVVDGFLETDGIELYPHDGYGILVVDGSLLFQDSIASGFTTLPPLKGYVAYGSLDVDVIGSTLSNNLAGALYMYDDGGGYHSLDISGSTFSGNTAAEHGADLYLLGMHDVTISDTEFTDAYAPLSGGSVYLMNSNVAFIDGAFRRNIAGEGGSIWAADYGYSGTLALTGTEFEDGWATDLEGQGGEISVTGVDVTLDSITSTYAVGGEGGFLFLEGGSLDMIGSDVSGATGNAGAALFLDTVDDVSVTHSTFCANAANYGGVLYQTGSRLWLAESVLLGNAAWFGMTVEAYDGQSSVVDDSFIDNPGYAAVYAEGGGVSVVNTIFDGSPYALTGDDTVEPGEIGYNLYWGRDTSDTEFNSIGGDVYEDPLYAASFDRMTCGSRPFLSAGSPAIDAGDPRRTDLDGSVSDIGAEPPEGTDTGEVPDDTGSTTDDTGVVPDDSGVVDADQDGYPAGEDCDDGDPGINPGASDDPFDDIDQDCDGEAASGVAHGGCACDAPGTPANGLLIVGAALLVRRRRG